MANENDNDLRPEGETEDEGNGAGLSTGKPAVAAAPGKMVFILALAGIFLFIVIRSLFFGGEPEVKKDDKPFKEKIAEQRNTPADMALPAVPVQPDTSSNNLTPPAPPPPPPPPLPAPPVPQLNTGTGVSNEALAARIKSPSIVSTSSLSKALMLDTKKQGKAGLAANDPNSAFAESVSQASGAERVEATSIGKLNITIAQGKLIHAVLETAINTDLPGPLRAIVSHDIYAESGRAVMIPKGSRLIGTYNSSIERGQQRVFIIWTRVIRPDGIDVAIDSPGVDSLGRAGLAADVDNKYFEAFSTAILTSALDIGVAVGGEALVGKNTTTQSTTAAGPTTTTSGTAGSAAVQAAVDNLGQVGKSIVGSALSLSPTLRVDQGTPVEVFVNKDLVFPGRVTGEARFVE